MKWTIRINEGEEIPRGYGIAYYDWRVSQLTPSMTVAMPMPFNFIVGAWRVLIRRIKLPWFRHYEWLLEHRWEEGFNAGWQAHGGLPLTRGQLAEQSKPFLPFSRRLGITKKGGRPA